MHLSQTESRIYIMPRHFQTLQRKYSVKMKYVLVTIFFLSLAFSVSKGMDDERESPTYFTLAMHWPISLYNAGQSCSKKFNRYFLSSFTIHGLWLHNANGEILNYSRTTEALTNSKVYL